MKRWQQWLAGIAGAALLLMGEARPAYAMHIMEGFLPPIWALCWFIAVLPFWIVGFRRVQRVVRDAPEVRLLLGFAAAYTFVLSALKLPSLTGSSSHPTGTGLGAMLFGPWVMSILGSMVLLFQALLIAHGGLTTLGANAFSMAVVGPWVAWCIWRWMHRRAPFWLTVFLAAALANLSTYVVTSLQLALAHPDPMGGIGASVIKFGTIFAVTQLPLAISEGILTVLIMNALQTTAASELEALELKGIRS